MSKHADINKFIESNKAVPLVEDIETVGALESIEIWLGRGRRVLGRVNAGRLQRMRIKMTEMQIRNSATTNLLSGLNQAKNLTGNTRTEFYKALETQNVTQGNYHLIPVIKAAARGNPTQAEIAARQNIITDKINTQGALLNEAAGGDVLGADEESPFVKLLTERTADTTYEELVQVQTDLRKDPNFKNIALNEDELNFISQYPQGVNRLGFTSVRGPVQAAQEAATSGIAAASAKGSVEGRVAAQVEAGVVSSTTTSKIPEATLVKMFNILGDLVKTQKIPRGTTTSEFRSEMAKIVSGQDSFIKNVTVQQAEDFLDVNPDFLTRALRESRERAAPKKTNLKDRKNNITASFKAGATRSNILAAMRASSEFKAMSQTEQAAIIKHINALKK